MPIKSFLFVLISLVFIQWNNAFAADEYYSGLSKTEAERNYRAINTSGVITQIEDVPNTKTSTNQNISDPHNILSNDAEQRIQALADGLNADKDYEIMVVCLNSIGQENPRMWGTELFNLWGIGDKDTENGLLVLLVNDIHRIEFITGRGLESVLTDAESYSIQQEHMIPYFKKNDYATGMIRGIQAVDDLLRGKAVLYDSDPNDVEVSENSTAPDRPFYTHPLFVGYAIFAGIVTLLYLFFLGFAFSTRDLHKRYRIMKFWTLLIFAFIAPVPFIFLVIYTRRIIDRWRNTERVGIKSGELLHKLTEEEEDEYLSEGQIAEEIVKSIDYDVWVNDSGTDVVILPYKNWFTPYDRCDKCHYKTYYKVHDRIVKSATYTHSGTGEKLYKCTNCKHEKRTTYRIPRKQRSTSKRYYSGGGSFGGGFGGGSSGGGFSGGSFGGGGSRGGGSGSSW